MKLPSAKQLEELKAKDPEAFRRLEIDTKLRVRTNRRETLPARFLTPKPVKCYSCSMPMAHRCEFTGCGLPMCAKHTIRKGGGKLCHAHRGAKLVQHESIPSPEVSLESTPATRFSKSNQFVTSPRK
jgi:hypothetical protein